MRESEGSLLIIGAVHVLLLYLWGIVRLSNLYIIIQSRPALPSTQDSIDNSLPSIDQEMRDESNDDSQGNQTYTYESHTGSWTNINVRR